MSAADFEHLLDHLAVGPASVDDLKGILRDSVNCRTALPDAVAWLVAAVGTDPVVHALADAVEPGNLVAALVEARVLEQALGGPGTLVQEPLYRLADQETDHG